MAMKKLKFTEKFASKFLVCSEVPCISDIFKHEETSKVGFLCPKNSKNFLGHKKYFILSIQ